MKTGYFGGIWTRIIRVGRRQVSWPLDHHHCSVQIFNYFLHSRKREDDPMPQLQLSDVQNSRNLGDGLEFISHDWRVPSATRIGSGPHRGQPHRGQPRACDRLSLSHVEAETKWPNAFRGCLFSNGRWCHWHCELGKPVFYIRFRPSSKWFMVISMKLFWSKFWVFKFKQ